jgi:hypothetical protein
MENAINWLLENENPAIKYRTLTEICGKNPVEIQDVYNSIWNHKQIIRMLSKQDENGLWHNQSKGYVSVDYLAAFAEFGIQKDYRLDNYVDYIINILQTRKTQDELKGCNSPLILRALVMMGYCERKDVLELVKEFANTQLYDGGFTCKRLLDKKPERKSCYKAAVTSLLLYAECKRKNILPDNTDKLIHYFTKRDVFYSSDMTKRFTDEKVGWRFIDNFFPAEPLRVGLPLIVSALSILGVGNHPALSEAWELLEEKDINNGKMQLEGTLTKQPCNFGKVGQFNKWVTFYAVLAKKHRDLTIS